MSPESSKRCLFLLAHVSNMYRNKSPLMNPIIGTLVVRVVLVGCSQPIMVLRVQGRLVFESRLWPFRPFWSTLRTVLRSTLEPKPPRKTFLVPPCTQIRGILRQVPQSDRGLCRDKCSKLRISRFVQISIGNVIIASVC